MTLADLGWSAHFRAQTAEAPEGAEPVRISSVARDRLTGLTPEGTVTLTLPGGDSTGAYAVGDWVLAAGGRVLRRLERTTELARRAAGTGAERQLIAANVDTLGIVTSCNADFNTARLERYLALAASSGCLPLVILTKADACEDAADYRRAAERLSPLVAAVTLDARDAQEVAGLAPWCGPGQTLALVGSSGVGKTTLTNALTGTEGAVQGIREDDAKGRHTTTHREVIRTRAGGWLIDTPGMRALRLTDAADGIDTVFADLDALAGQCRFADCGHDTEPGCAIQAAIAAGEVLLERLERWRKLKREDARNSATVAEARARDKAFGKMVRGVIAEKKQRR